MVSAAAFLPKQEKLSYVRTAIRKSDALKLLLLILWETKSLDTKKYAALCAPLDEVGKMLGGWQGQLVKNSAPREGAGLKCKGQSGQVQYKCQRVEDTSGTPANDQSSCQSRPPRLTYTRRASGQR